MNTIQQYHHRKPQLLGQRKHDRYIYAICRCPKDTRYGLVVDRNELTEYEKETGYCYIHCTICGSDIAIGIGKGGNIRE